jgi:hypothetical protein
VDTRLVAAANVSLVQLFEAGEGYCAAMIMASL